MDERSSIEEFLARSQAFWLRADHVQVGDRLDILDEPVVDEESFDKPYLVMKVRLQRTGEEFNLRLGVRNVQRIAETLGRESWRGHQLEVIAVEEYPGLGRRGILFKGVKAERIQPSERLLTWLHFNEALVGKALPSVILQTMPPDIRSELERLGWLVKRGEAWVLTRGR